MKLTLEVLTAGKWQGKSIAISQLPFLIGRDARCHLRPASPLISFRHCALLVRGGKLFIHDFGSTNGTFVNGERVQKEKELHPLDRLQVGTISFTVFLQTNPAVSDPTPFPPTKASRASDEEAAALFLSQGDDCPPSPDRAPDDTNFPGGRTQLIAPDGMAPEDRANSGRAPAPARKTHDANTSSAAKAILEKYRRRQRP